MVPGLCIISSFYKSEPLAINENIMIFSICLSAMVASAPHGTKSVSATTSAGGSYNSNVAWGGGSGGRSVSATTAAGGTFNSNSAWGGGSYSKDATAKSARGGTASKNVKGNY
jgi:hypothetical protein